jgi:prephenate dehydrogenase
MPLDRRLQLLLDEGRYRRVAATARERGTSVAAVIRAAIDQAVPDDVESKRDAAAAILAAEPMAVPATAEELKAELDEARAGGL